MAITDPQAIRSANEDVRPLAESLRAFLARADDYIARWDANLGALVPDDLAETLEDGRDAEGVSRLTGQDINRFVAILKGLQTQADVPNIRDQITKPTVRGLRV